MDLWPGDMPQLATTAAANHRWRNVSHSLRDRGLRSVRTPCYWGAKDKRAHVCHSNARTVARLTHGNLFLFTTRRNTWPHDALEPSGTACRAAAPWSQPIRSTEYIAGGFCVGLFFFSFLNWEWGSAWLFLPLLQIVKPLVIYKKAHLTYFGVFAFFFSMDYSHLQKCPRAAQAQCLSFIAKNACQEFWSKAPPQLHVPDGPHHYTN